MQDTLTHTEIINLKQRYELILQSIGEGVYGLDSNGNTTFVNPAAEVMTGWLSDDLIGEVVHDFHHHTKIDGSHYPSFDCPVYKTIQDGIGRHVDDEVFWRKDGSSFPVEYVTTAIVRDDKIIGAVVVFKDISERKQADEQLKAALSQVEKLKETLQAENHYLREEIKEEHNFSKIIGNSPALHQILTQIEHVAPTNASVLIQGDSGTGKELIARAIHSASNRKDRPLVKVNCGAISPNLVESELFGHEKGAFTGALQQRIGRFELANGGTLFLDEVGELPLDIQVKLLRVLQEGEFERVGSSTTQKIDVRIIAATNRNILDMIDNATFRSDLYYRLSVFPIQVPSLQQRKEDLPMLVNHIMGRLNQALGKKYEAISASSLEQLNHYHWPGNIRELQNILERAAIVGHPPILEVNNLPNQIQQTTTTLPASTTLAEVERQHIINTLNSVNWIIAGKQGAAAMLDLPPSTLRSKMKKLAITRPA
ncbi:sigma-54 interaction domain-containing protein [Alkalimarinus sediminis]|uniref:Sigma 54-interacting transcriptional regulator n=1 Tax=Alkalimarinus sediminis TaxID=1632866 RepID=A0A9E8KNX9_9ALTE|nr:sigma 54-interacting transcriptional regulator [Alkalimarinus sediminis]UZW74843.1 sigma 54-interacting transcriptional regulator [Alkalimarinus sediminis]